MTFVLDTNILIDVERGDADTLHKLAELSKDERPAITAPTYAEYYYGFLDKPLSARLQAIHGLDVYDVLNTTKESARITAELKKATERTGSALSVFDLFIAAITIDNSGTLLTKDAAFAKVPNLKFMLL